MLKTHRRTRTLLSDRDELIVHIIFITAAASSADTSKAVIGVEGTKVSRQGGAKWVWKYQSSCAWNRLSQSEPLNSLLLRQGGVYVSRVKSAAQWRGDSESTYIAVTDDTLWNKIVERGKALRTRALAKVKQTDYEIRKIKRKMGNFSCWLENRNRWYVI